MYSAIFADLINSTVEECIKDIIRFDKFSNYRSISILKSTSKKSPSCPISPVEKWHPSDLHYAYEYLFQDISIERAYDSGIVACDLQSMLTCLPIHVDLDKFRKLIVKQITSELGYMPQPAFGISFFVDAENGDIDMKKISDGLIDKLIAMSQQSELDWQHDEKSENGCVPEYVTDKDKAMAHCDTYVTSLEHDENGTLVLSLSCYEKEAHGKNDSPARKYREYILSAQLITDNGYGSTIEIKGMGKLWRMVAGGKKAFSPQLSLTSLHEFLNQF